MDFMQMRIYLEVRKELEYIGFKFAKWVQYDAGFPIDVRVRKSHLSLENLVQILLYSVGGETQKCILNRSKFNSQLSVV
jgi:hypothetical protein